MFVFLVVVVVVVVIVVDDVVFSLPSSRESFFTQASYFCDSK